ncbi:hypothetical protein Mal4_24450 [Maioricimonas rarisocia]|uniref:Uncharacterized protein n=1 Tax=Maioricimonas rarisocia TaxID=2528026 RepID=A0A517Z6K8_9PLAN|nr:hypothetical protein Mal4_24450 [Maioricimonas rarisocia]
MAPAVMRGRDWNERIEWNSRNRLTRQQGLFSGETRRADQPACHGSVSRARAMPALASAAGWPWLERVTRAKPREQAREARQWDSRKKAGRDRSRHFERQATGRGWPSRRNASKEENHSHRAAASTVIARAGTPAASLRTFLVQAAVNGSSQVAYDVPLELLRAKTPEVDNVKVHQHVFGRDRPAT